MLIYECKKFWICLKLSSMINVFIYYFFFNQKDSSVFSFGMGQVQV